MVNYFNILQADHSGATEPVDLPAIKAWATIDYDDFDDLLTSMGKGARNSIEQFTQIGLVAKDVSFDCELSKCDEAIILPYALKVTSVEVKKLADDDTPTTLASGTDYFVRGNLMRGLDVGRYSIAYTTIPVVSEDLKEAIKMEVAERFAQRGENNQRRGSINDLSLAAKVKAAPYQMTWL